MLSDDPWIGIFSFFRLVLTQVGVNLSIAIKSLIDCNFNASDFLQCCYSVYSIKQKLGFIWLYETSNWTFIRYTFTKYGEANLKHLQFYLSVKLIQSLILVSHIHLWIERPVANNLITSSSSISHQGKYNRKSPLTQALNCSCIADLIRAAAWQLN